VAVPAQSAGTTTFHVTVDLLPADATDLCFLENGIVVFTPIERFPSLDAVLNPLLAEYMVIASPLRCSDSLAWADRGRWFLGNGRGIEPPKYRDAVDRRQYRAQRDAFLARAEKLPGRLRRHASWRALLWIAPALLVAAAVAGCGRGGGIGFEAMMTDQQLRTGRLSARNTVVWGLSFPKAGGSEKTRQLAEFGS
jgi:hypothetical protein